MKSFVVLIAVALVLSYAVRAILPASVNSPTRLATRADACAMSQKFVKDALKAPSTAKFSIWTEEDCQVTQQGHIWKVHSFVDAQNSFGAMLRSDYDAKMIYYPSTEQWTLVDMRIIDH